MLWIIDIYGFFVAGSLITMGTLGDRIGRRRLLLLGAVAFGVGSILAAFAPSALAFVARQRRLTDPMIDVGLLRLTRFNAAPPEQAGAASGISETGPELGGALGIAIMGSIGVAIYRGELADRLPAGVPDAATAAARDTLVVLRDEPAAGDEDASPLKIGTGETAG